MDYDSCGGTRLQIEPSGSLRGPNKGREKHGWKNNNNLPPSSFHELLQDVSFMPRCFSSSSPSFFCVLSSPLTSAKIHRKLLPQWDFFTHLLLIRDLNAHWRRTPPGSWLYFTTHKQTLSQIRLLTCASLGSTWQQAGLRCAALKRLHGRPAIAVLMNGWTSGYWPPLRLWCMECLVLGRLTWGWKAVLYLRVEVWAWLGGSGRAFGGLERHSDRVKTAVSHYAPL